MRGRQQVSAPPNRRSAGPASFGGISARIGWLHRPKRVQPAPYRPGHPGNVREDGVGAGLDAACAGVRDGGVVLVRPDGFIGFRAVPADTAGMDALDAHLASYLVPVRGGRDGIDDLGGTAGVAVQLPPGR